MQVRLIDSFGLIYYLSVMYQARRLALPVLAGLLIAPGAVRAQSHGPHTAHQQQMMTDRKADWGYLVFPISSRSEEAQQEFVHGVAALHDFLYPEARAAFQKAQALEPAHFMAVVAEAMTHTYLLWGSEDLESGRKALAKLGETREARARKAPSMR